MSEDDAWTPDRKTVEWWMGSADENRIVVTFIEEVRRRGGDVPYDSDAYWQLAADIAVRLTSGDMRVMAESAPAQVARTVQWIEQNEVEVMSEWKVSSAAEAIDKFGYTWIPDSETVRWWTELATGDRIVESLEREVKERGVGLELHSDAYWHLVAEVAVEHLHFELYDTAKAWGTDVSDPADPVEQPPPL